MTTDPPAGSPQFEALGPLELEATCCPICGGKETSKWLHKTVQNVAMAYALCDTCSTLYANPRLTVDSLRSMYSSQEFFEGREDNINYYSFLAGESYLRRTARGRVARFAGVAPGNRLLEVASAAGFFLAEAKDAGFSCEGVEFSRPMAEYASQRWGVPVQPASIEEIDLPTEAYDVIASWGLMTIIRDPKALFEKFHRALRPGGVWAFNTYDHQTLWAKAFGSKWYILVLNTSQIFTDATLRRTISDVGFELVRRRRDRPYASLERLLFVLATHGGDQRVSSRLFERIHLLNRFVVPVVAPDAYEYIWVKR